MGTDADTKDSAQSAFTSSVYRPAGALEHFHIAKQVRGLDSCIVLSAHVVRGIQSFSGEATSAAAARILTKESVYGAVRHALNTHAALSARIKTDTENGIPAYERMNSVDLKRVVRFHDGVDTRAPGSSAGFANKFDISTFFERELLEPLDARNDVPLWRLTVLPDDRIVLAWHHAIGDGQSGLALLQTLLDGLTSWNALRSDLPNEGGLSTMVSIPRDLQMTPAFEDLTSTSISFKTLFKELSGLFLPKSWTQPAGLWTGNPIINHVPGDSPVKTHVRSFSLEPTASAQLLSACRAHDSTITGALYVLTLVALSRVLQSNESVCLWKNLSGFVPVSLRPLTDPRISHSAMADLVSSYHTSSPLIASFSWEEAAAFAKELHAAVPTTREIIGLARMLQSRFNKLLAGGMGKSRDASFALSNIGAVNFELSSTDWRVEDMYFAQADNVAGAAFKVNVVGSPDGALNMCVTWGTGAIDDTMAELIVRELQVTIDELLVGSDS